jgi:hypothetical protein
MNCILGDGGSARKYILYPVGLIVIHRDGSWQDVAGLDRTSVNVVCILILLSRLFPCLRISGNTGKVRAIAVIGVFGIHMVLYHRF